MATPRAKAIAAHGNRPSHCARLAVRALPIGPYRLNDMKTLGISSFGNFDGKFKRRRAALTLVQGPLSFALPWWQQPPGVEKRGPLAAWQNLMHVTRCWCVCCSGRA